ncbi:MAG: hypothetical protein F2652_06475 [Actinobacteria bacterium]|nr:hypothetical protein [Actinomycetota bacterium]
MPKYMISFNDGDMTFPEEDFPAVAKAAHEVMREGVEAGIWLEGGGGFMGYSPRVVGLDGWVSDGPLTASPVHIGGFSVIQVASDEEAHRWAHKIAVACRCPQEVRKIMDDPEGDRIFLGNASL